MSGASSSPGADNAPIVPAVRRHTANDRIAVQPALSVASRPHQRHDLAAIAPPANGDPAVRAVSRGDRAAAAKAAADAAAHATAAARPLIDRTRKRMEKDRTRIAAEADSERRLRMEEQHQRDCERIAAYADAVATEVARSTTLLALLQRPAGIPPVGAFSGAIRCHASSATIAGALGRLRLVPWQGDAASAIRLAASVLSAQAPPRMSATAPPIRHVAHLVISAPHGRATFPFRWDRDLAVAVSRHAMRSQGCDPDAHDALMVIHSQRRAQGADHDEEAVHVLWSRIRHDGCCLTTPNAFVAAQLGRARWDARAGLDPMYVGIGRLASHPVRQGYALLAQGCLAACYRDLSSGAQTIVPLQGAEFLAVLATEVAPRPLSCAGLWTPKPCYRSQAEITRILAHLYQPARAGG